jgi:hypothetical protein
MGWSRIPIFSSNEDSILLFCLNEEFFNGDGIAIKRGICCKHFEEELKISIRTCLENVKYDDVKISGYHLHKS